MKTRAATITSKSELRAPIDVQHLRGKAPRVVDREHHDVGADLCPHMCTRAHLVPGSLTLDSGSSCTPQCLPGYMASATEITCENGRLSLDTFHCQEDAICAFYQRARAPILAQWVRRPKSWRSLGQRPHVSPIGEQPAQLSVLGKCSLVESAKRCPAKSAVALVVPTTASCDALGALGWSQPRRNGDTEMSTSLCGIALESAPRCWYRLSRWSRGSRNRPCACIACGGSLA